LGQKGVTISDLRGGFEFSIFVLDNDLFGHVQVKTRRPFGIASLIMLSFGVLFRRLRATLGG
jgi:hypothetical protein